MAAALNPGQFLHGLQIGMQAVRSMGFGIRDAFVPSSFSIPLASHLL